MLPRVITGCFAGGSAVVATCAWATVLNTTAAARSDALNMTRAYVPEWMVYTPEHGTSMVVRSWPEADSRVRPGARRFCLAGTNCGELVALPVARFRMLLR